ncbi:hypothetical protein SAMN05216188_10479 [Lentzea xinjiangensis]|uniref:Uncharacterized protein n=1 Tax=Lentzea xinjiangensis TaxID=402600 RepID=A0A1H9HKJ8_9PSEU|nr:DUF6228 family protein [Lentzea xinjiangensis]SEQ62776.1 hypothetical protein SAMN05216188_10479 [Lentzea xinjiangensis]
MITSCPHDWLLPEPDLTCLDDAEVVFRCERDPSVSVRFAERHAAVAPQDGRMFFVVAAQAPRLEARLEGVTNFVVGRGLARFLDRLDFRGWQGERRWANADRDLAVAAVFESGGHVALTWTLRPWRSAHGGWEATVITRLEAGAMKDDLAGRLDAFLTADGWPVQYFESDDEFR